MQLFALITKQDGGIGEKEIDYVNRFLIQQIGVESSREYLELYKDTAGGPEEKKLTSVLDSVKVLKLCKQISKTINQRQKVVVLVRILELVNAEYNLTEQRLEIVNTVSDIFRISKEEFKSIFAFVTEDSSESVNHENHMVVSGLRPDPDDEPADPEKQRHSAHHYHFPGIEEPVFFTRVPSVELYFMKYTGSQDCFLNGLGVHRGVIYLFATGSTLRLPVGQPILYSDIASKFLTDLAEDQISLEADKLSYIFPGNVTGLNGVSFSAQQGNLVGIMGSSGSGKTTLMNVLSGMYKPSSGQVRINNLDLHSDTSKLTGVSGFVPQDDLLIEELSVFDNLYFNAKFCFKHLSDKEVREKVTETLTNLGLYDKRDLRVGSVMNKTISGGQRKRLNIALELIREPSILFLDEPTSGLSSRDSENVMDLLRELTLKGKLVFVVIHQPSSELYKMFDRVVILDEGGRLVFFGNPVEAVIHFKGADNQVNAGVGECPICGNVNPELIFNTIEAHKVDEYGNYTGQRKVSPQTWEEIYIKKRTAIDAAQKAGAIANTEYADKFSPPPINLNVPGWLKQFFNYLKRDVKSKINNPQYLRMTLLVSPVLAFILAYIIRYIADPTSQTYVFRENENIPIFIFMALIVALFLGLIVSAEEIFKDRKILKREQFLNLSRSSYLLAKIGTLVAISAVQAITFVLVANGILEIRQMTLAYWLALFSTAVCANMIGLVISSAFSSAVTIYIVIPLVMIPMMVLSGAMFSFEKLNRRITTVDKVPIIAELMVTKWSYEALMVHQFKANKFEKNFYGDEKRISANNFKAAYLVPELEQRLNACAYEFRETGKITTTKVALEVLWNEIRRADPLVKDISFKEGELMPETFSEAVISKTTRFLNALKQHYINQFSIASKLKERRLAKLMKDRRDLYFSMLDQYHNESVSDHVKKIYEKNQVIESGKRLYQQIDPIFLDPVPEGLGIRSHFYSPRKYFIGTYFETYKFNLGFIWFLTIVLYLILYFDLSGKIVNSRIFKRKAN
ncbi:MAG: ATP-binding cassette domain-containing protein [Bacteroidetes bacterium]|nr:ATP-binding cassette domain-containing protein [Bacteroidota bacterium]